MRASFAIVLTALALSPALSHSATWVVDPSGAGDATTIQAGVDLASAGDTVLVTAGTYIEQIVLDKDDLTIVGVSGAEATVVYSAWMRFSLRMTPDAKTTVLSGLTFTGVHSGYDPDAPPSYVLRLHGDVEVRECVIRDNFCNQIAAVNGSGSLIVAGTHFELNRAWPEDWNQGEASCEAPCVDWSGYLEIEDSRFVRNAAHCLAILRTEGDAVIRRSTFEDNGSREVPEFMRSGSLFSFEGGAVLEGNLFVRNRGNLFTSSGSPPVVDVRRNTFVAALEPNRGFRPIIGAPGSVIRANVFTGAQVGVYVPVDLDGMVVECNDSWGNDVNWKGPDLEGVDGNFSLQPFYCDPDAGNFKVASNSPLMPTQNSCFTAIGAFGNGCLLLSLEPMSWGAVKSKYRSSP